MQKEVDVVNETEMTRYNTICCASFILIQVFITVTSQVFPTTLTTKIWIDYEWVELNWIRTQNYLANQNLPLWYARKDREPILIENVMNNLGEFAMYHDVDKSSAVVYFHKAACLSGTIDTRFLINCLPLSELDPNKYLIVDEKYVQRRDESILYHDRVFHPLMFPHLTAKNFINPPTTNSKPSSTSGPSHKLPFPSDRNPRARCRAGPSQTHQIIKDKFVQAHPREFDPLYPELLLYISYNVVKQFRTVKQLVEYYLVHFNVVDMLYAKLARDGVKIHINIAGMVLESGHNVFPYAYVDEQSSLSSRLHGPKTINKFPTYSKTYGKIFTDDSFDFSILLTDVEIQFQNIKVDGLARMDMDVYNQRKISAHDENINVSPGMIIHYKRDHGDFAVCAHELAHVMGVDHDPQDAGNKCFNTQCYAILQPTSSTCKNCIVWSIESRFQFRTYVSSNKNHCFLLNEPRSLHPYNVPIKTIDPHQQCACYGYKFHWTHPGYVDRVDGHACNQLLTCASMGAAVPDQTLLPVDGTPCDTDKVCWNRECQSLVLS